MKEAEGRNQGLGKYWQASSSGNSQGFRCKKREKRDDSRPGWWEYQGGMDQKIGDTREQEQGSLGIENVQREKGVIYIVLGQRVRGSKVGISLEVQGICWGERWVNTVELHSKN